MPPYNTGLIVTRCTTCGRRRRNRRISASSAQLLQRMLAAARHGNGVVRHAQGLDIGHGRPVHGGHVHVIAGALRGQGHGQAMRHEERRIVDHE